MSCGYHHVCRREGAFFISRYRNENDYCVAGVRVTLHDTEGFRNGTEAEREAVRLKILDDYAAYLRFRAGFTGGRAFQPLEPLSAWGL